MVYLTGDTHIPVDIDKLSTKNFIEGDNLTREDYIIVLGDFGLLWHNDKTYKYWLNILSNKKYTILWLDGNHENHSWINSLSISEWHGGKVHYISDNIIHLMCGQVFNIDNKKFFVCGGASSVDKYHRIEGISWWPEEDINCSQIMEAEKNLNINNWQVDYILTHTCPKFLVNNMFKVEYIKDPTSEFLEDIYTDIEFKKWYFGHWHIDKEYGKFYSLYNNIIKLDIN